MGLWGRWYREGTNLTTGTRYADQHDEYVIEPYPLRNVTFPAGQVVGCDPLTAEDAEPFTVRVAALHVVIRHELTVWCEPVLVTGNDPSALGENEFFGYGVDAGRTRWPT